MTVSSFKETTYKKNTKKITISLPKPLAEQFKASIPARQRSLFITKILEEYFALQEQVEALDETAGCWQDKNHPDMMTGEDIDNWLVDLRRGWQRKESN